MTSFTSNHIPCTLTNPQRVQFSLELLPIEEIVPVQLTDVFKYNNLIPIHLYCTWTEVKTLQWENKHHDT